VRNRERNSYRRKNDYAGCDGLCEAKRMKSRELNLARREYSAGNYYYAGPGAFTQG
jgi:hypothetical protein